MLAMSDDQFSTNLVLRSVKDQVERVGTCAPSLPEPQPMSDEREQLLEQMASLIRDFGDSLDREPKFNDMVDGFARVADRQSFQKLVDKVFVDDITWGKIVTLICVVGKSIAKILADLVSGVVSWTLDYFRDNLLNWICNRGGWINSISSLAHYSFERDFGSSSSLISLSSGVLFISGVLLGGLIVWRLNRCA
ncbi:apoptosis regulator BAX [Sinocyclocheilus grahami]|uniref:apoptosis regulator BAX n=2 Tax=Sinocyclocheilus TaxID=75365 RepID=UPI0007AC5A14|nr:PREDICTED: apoptosis regulator BAX-like [Sinocyclocheilus grahami]